MSTAVGPPQVLLTHAHTFDMRNPGSLGIVRSLQVWIETILFTLQQKLKMNLNWGIRFLLHQYSTHTIRSSYIENFRAIFSVSWLQNDFNFYYLLPLALRLWMQCTQISCDLFEMQSTFGTIHIQISRHCMHIEWGWTDCDRFSGFMRQKAMRRFLCDTMHAFIRIYIFQ